MALGFGNLEKVVVDGQMPVLVVDHSLLVNKFKAIGHKYKRIFWEQLQLQLFFWDNYNIITKRSTRR